jgi:predicted phage tail component-like protein
MADVSSGVIYDGFNFGDNGLVVTDLNHLIIPKRNNQTERLANRSGAKLVQSQLDVKTIPIKGYYLGASIYDAQNMYDILASMLNRQERTLVVPHASGSRYYTATPETAIIEEPDGLNRLEWDFEFVVPEGNAKAPTSTTLITSQSITTSTATIPLTVQGSVTARPFISLTFNTITGGTSGIVTIRNGRDFVGLTITRNFTSGDVITIDSENFQIYINGVLTAPVGRMPTWAAGSGSLYYSDSFTTRSVTISATYNRKDL